LFSLGLLGILLIAAVPLLAIYAVAGLVLTAAVVAANRSNAPVLFAAGSGSVARISLFAWLASVALFAVCGTLNHWLTQYSGNTILRLYPLLQQLASLVFFFWFLVHRVSSKYAAQPATARARVLWSLAVAAAPTVLLVAAANVWHLSRGNS
jgi:hypothetical protein